VRALSRVAAVAAAGATLYYAGLVNSIVLTHPGKPGAVAVVIAIAAAFALLIAALTGTGRGDAATTTRHVAWHRAAWAFVSIMALVGVGWFWDLPREKSYDWTPYHNDAIALNECAARLLVEGRDPYRDLDLFACYGRLRIGADRTTPLRRGLFADDVVYPTDDELDAAWAVRSAGQGPSDEFVWRPSYPALSIVPLVPFVLLGWDTNYLYVACLFAAMGLVLARAPRGLRPFILTALFGAASLVAFTVGGSADLLYAVPLVAAWLWRERRWSALALGIAIATKQTAWFFVAFYLISSTTELGFRESARRLAIACAVFVAANLPFILWDWRSWLLGVLTPALEPMFPRGAGLVFLSTNGPFPLLPPLAYAALEVAAYAICLAVAWQRRRTSPELGVVLAVLPLFFAWRSLFSYFFLVPLFALAGIARMPLGDVGPDRARAVGGLTLFAAPVRTP
jgi:hypothetical protein